MTHFDLAALKANLAPLSAPVDVRRPEEVAYLLARGWTESGLPTSPWAHPTNHLSCYGHHTAVTMQIERDRQIEQPIAAWAPARA